MKNKVIIIRGDYFGELKSPYDEYEFPLLQNHLEERWTVKDVYQLNQNTGETRSQYFVLTFILQKED